MDLFLDLARLLNALLASLVFCALVYKGRLYFSRYDGHQRLLYISMTMYAFATAYASLEAYALEIEPGWRILPFFIANAFAITAFTKYHRSAFAKPDGA